MKELTKQERTIYDELCKGTRQLDIMYDHKIDKFDMVDYMNNLVTKGYIKREANGKVRILRQQDIPQLKKVEKAPMRIESTWSQSPPLKHDYIKVNGEVERFNYKELPPDNPVRMQIERTLAQVKPKAKPIETVSIASARKQRGMGA
jgi:hypothetical protein